MTNAKFPASGARRPQGPPSGRAALISRQSVNPEYNPRGGGAHVGAYRLRGYQSPFRNPSKSWQFPGLVPRLVPR